MSLCSLQTQEREAKNKMREKAKELQRQRMEAAKKGMKSPGFGGGGFGRDTGYTSTPTVGDTANLPEELSKLGFIAVQKPVILTKAMKLGSKARDVESFVDQLKSEGEKVVVPVSNKTVLPTNKLPENVHEVDAEGVPHLGNVRLRTCRRQLRYSGHLHKK
uniref:Coatomer subunit delta n=1 Tax=Timema shepardi TaxID=629360 RepID=A0A7R9G8K9_TIMSH|nr:unnamed protein product [Timema shepardi]